MKNRLVIITGASAGIGAAAAIEFNKKFKSKTEFILLARNINNLIKTKNEMLNSNKINEGLIKLVQFDFSTQNIETIDYFNVLISALDINNKSYDELIVVYNHGTLDYGLIEKANNEILQKKFQTNFFSIWLLLNAIQNLIPETLPTKQFHINLNSSFATNPSQNWSIQCCARSSRLMLFKCLAIEKPQYRVLNYDPGIVYTEGAKLVYDENLFSEKFQKDYENGVFVTPQETILNLLKIIEEDKFISGDCLRYAPYNLIDS